MARMNVFAVEFRDLYAAYLAKAKRKGRTEAEVEQIICWLTGYTEKGLEKQMKKGNDLTAFFDQAPRMNPHASLIKGVVCGVRVEDVKDPLMKKIRLMDKLVDELANGKAMEKILRKPEA